MTISNVLRHQIIETLTAQNAEKVADTAIILWEKLAAQIISVVGEDGFNTLYERSVFLNQSIFPWLPGLLSCKTNQRFTGLKMSLEAQTPEQASTANSLLLITFTDILALLIGEQLTSHILSLAWGADIWSGTIKEFKNE